MKLKDLFYFLTNLFQDLLPAMKALGISPNEQEVKSKLNYVNSWFQCFSNSHQNKWFHHNIPIFSFKKREFPTHLIPVFSCLICNVSGGWYAVWNGKEVRKNSSDWQGGEVGVFESMCFIHLHISIYNKPPTISSRGRIFFPDFCHLCLRKFREFNEDHFRQELFKVTNSKRVEFKQLFNIFFFRYFVAQIRIR